MMNESFLWIDFQRNAASPSLFETLPPLYRACIVRHPSDITPYIIEEKPQFICFEFDYPSKRDLETLQKTKQRHPEIPILMITNPHTEALAIWAFRSGVRDYLIKPLAHEYLNASIEALTQLCQQRSKDRLRVHLFPPCPLSEEQLEGRKESNIQKTAVALEFVNGHFSEEIRLSDVASLCYLSESSFSRMFKKEQGMNFSEYVMKMRIRRACELLSNAAIQVKAVAFSVGFNDLSYFTRIFKRYIGVTPSHYQRSPSSFNAVCE